MNGPLKPKVLGDVVRGGRWDAFGGPSGRINLSDKKALRFPAVNIAKTLILLAAAVFFVFGSVTAPTIFMRAVGSATTTDSTAERAQLQDQLQQLETQINQYEGQVTSYQKQGKTLNGEISTLNSKIAKLNLQIQATNLTISQLDKQIASTQSEITVTQADIGDKKAAIGGLIQNLYQNDHVSLVEVFLKNPRLSDFWSDTQNVMLLQDNLRVAVQQITDLEGQLIGQKDQFQASKSDAATARVYQQAQVGEVASTKDQKSQLLAATKGQESKYQTLLKQTQATAAQIRNRIFQLLGGGELSFEEAYQYAKLASSATGIDPAFILAILDNESALGQNVGRCSYKTAMSPSNVPIFLQITQSLGLRPDDMLVSCANRDGAYGGAMGPAQFVPSTWALYASGVSTITGDNPASPWKNADAFVATALYLKDGMVGCKTVYPTSVVSQERCTAAKYYAGSRWKSYLWTYGETVVDRAQSFADDIKTITS
jgi:membrane-bound lytic murein transglycosylase B